MADTSDEKKSFFERAEEAIEGAVESTIEAAKEHPVAAAGIAAAAVAGAAYGASKLHGHDESGDGSDKG